MVRAPVGFTLIEWRSMTEEDREKVRKERRLKSIHNWQQRNPDKVKNSASNYYKTHTEECKRKNVNRYDRFVHENEALKKLLTEHGIDYSKVIEISQNDACNRGTKSEPLGGGIK